VETIVSRNNERVKHFVRVSRGAGDEPDLFTLEGPKLLAEAVRSGHEVRCVFVLGELEARLPPTPEALRFQVTRGVMDKLSTLAEPSWLAAICRRRDRWSVAEVAGAPFWLVLDGIQDPGNVGAICRSADAFGPTPLVLLPPAPSPFADKVVRASAGSSMRVRFRGPEDPASFVAACRQAGRSIWGLAADGGQDLPGQAPEAPAAFVIGNEGHGLSPVIRDNLAGSLRIPIAADVESLNASVSAAILLYHLWVASKHPAREP